MCVPLGASSYRGGAAATLKLVRVQDEAALAGCTRDIPHLIPARSPRQQMPRTPSFQRPKSVGAHTSAISNCMIKTAGPSCFRLSSTETDKLTSTFQKATSPSLEKLSQSNLNPASMRMVYFDGSRALRMPSSGHQSRAAALI